MSTVSGRKPPAAKADPAPAKPAVARPPAGNPAAAPAPAGPPPTARQHADVFERAVREFHARNFSAALTLFEQSGNGPDRQVAHTAGQHARICARQLARHELALRTPDEHYDYAIALINQRRLEQAEKHLLHAIAQTPRGDHLYYALALCRGLAGDLHGAWLNLRHAIELNPRNRAGARNDPDFAEIGQLAPLRELLYP